MNIYNTLKSKKDKKIIIYGVSILSEALKIDIENSGFKLWAYAVSEGYKTKDSLNNIPIYEISDLPFPKEQCFFLICVGERFKQEIENRLKNMNYCDYQYVCIADFNAYTSKVYRDFFAQNKIDLEQPTITIGDLELQNYLLTNRASTSKELFLAEFGDLILPPILKVENYMLEGPYEYERVTLNKGDVVFDCGANLGLFSAVAALKGCDVFAFEPFLENIENLKLICKKYMKNIYPIQLALSDKCKTESFNVVETSSASRLKNAEEEEFLNKIGPVIKDVIKVEVTTIDDFAAKNNINKLDFIKADIEGEERNMLKGAKHTLKTLAPKLSLCTYHRADDKEVMEKIILDANPNYKIIHKWKKLYAWVE